MKLKTIIIYIIIIFALGELYVFYSESWQNEVMPGKLSKAHKQLETNCASCHSAVKGIDDAKCISCHADNKALLERQPTAFHGNIGNCASCHIEHRGLDANLKKMDHIALANIGIKMISEGKTKLNIPITSIMPEGHPLVSTLEAKLECASCHNTKDKHIGLMGKNCASCHSSTEWTIPNFQHPSVNSIVCSQCHQAPPSHYMMHFEMIDKKIAARDNANGNGCCGGVNVSQCYNCHQTTAWNDIKGVGYYKHH